MSRRETRYCERIPVTYLAVLYEDRGQNVIWITYAVERGDVAVVCGERECLDLLLMRCEKKDGVRTVDMHPSLLQLQCAVGLYIVYPIAETLVDGRVQNVTKPGLKSKLKSQHGLLWRRNYRNSDVRFSLKPRKVGCCPEGELDGSQPMIVLESGDGGGEERKESAKAGFVCERGVGGAMRW